MDPKQVKQDLLTGDDPTIIIGGDVESRMYEETAAALLFLKSRGSPAVTIIIDSPGGEVDAGLDIFDAIRLYSGKKTGLVLNRAVSMGAVILQACDERCCARHAAVLIHHVSRTRVSLDELVCKKRLDRVIDDLKKNQERIYEILTHRTGKTVAQVRTECKKNKMMRAPEALSFGLIDKIV